MRKHSFKDSSTFIVEEFLAEEEITTTTMPSAQAESNRGYWSLQILTLFYHKDGVAPIMA
jgi:hypothetical protein